MTTVRCKFTCMSKREFKSCGESLYDYQFSPSLFTEHGVLIKTFFEPGTHWILATDEAVAQKVPIDQWHVALGPVGTLLLADTTGWHKGGHATGAQRLSAVWMWMTSRDRWRSQFKKVAEKRE